MPSSHSYYNGSRVVFTVFLGYVVWWYLEGNYRFPALGEYRFEAIVGAGLTILAVPAYFRNPNRESSSLAIWISLLFAAMAVMVPLSYVPDTSWDTFVNRVIKFALFGLFIAAFVTTPKRLAWFIGAFLFACLKMDQEGFLGTITGSLIWENQGIPRLHGSTPMYGHPNSLAGMAVGSLPFIIYFYQVAPRYLRWVLGTQLFLAVFVILYTGSRTGYVALFLGLLALIWKAKHRLRVILLLLVVGAAAAPFIPEDYIGRAQSIFTLEEKEGHSAEARELILQDGWEILRQNPLGIGVYAFRAVRIARFGRDEDPHNLYLEIATNLGIQGLLIFLGFIAALLRQLVRLDANIRGQIDSIRSVLDRKAGAIISERKLHDQLSDLQIMHAACRATYLFVMIRLALGLFGHDLYEIYWWFALGVTVAVTNMRAVAEKRTADICTEGGLVLSQAPDQSYPTVQQKGVAGANP